VIPGDEKRIDLSILFKIFGLLFTQFYVRMRVADETAFVLTQPETALGFSAFLPFLLILGGFVERVLDFICSSRRGRSCKTHVLLAEPEAFCSCLANLAEQYSR